MESMQETHMETAELSVSLNNVTEVTFNGNPGFGFGNGKISRDSYGELEAKGFEYITNNPEAFIAVDKLDDGCSDGRIAVYAEQIQPDGTVEHSEQLLNRAKIFGGGLVMTIAGKIGTGIIAPSTDAQFENGLNYLKARNIKFGAHDDDHAQGDNCGCGAIDKYPENIRNTQHFKSEIKEVFITLFGNDFNDDVFEEVSENYRQAYTIVAEEDTYSGKQIRDRIARTGAVIKTLTGNHQEDFVVINFVPETTLNQAGLIKDSDNAVQAFCIDAWKLAAYANIVADGTGEDTTNKALYGMLMYTLATSGTLTDGTQRVLVRK